MFQAESHSATSTLMSAEGSRGLSSAVANTAPEIRPCTHRIMLHGTLNRPELLYGMRPTGLVIGESSRTRHGWTRGA